MKPILRLAAATALSGSLGATPISFGPFKADLNPAFPGILSYGLGDQTVTIPAATNPVVILNGKEYKPQVVTSNDANGSWQVYRLVFQEPGVTMDLQFIASRDGIEIRVVNIFEKGAFAVRTIEIPGLVLLTGTAEDEVAIGNFPAASYASEKPEDHDIFSKVATLEFKDNYTNLKKNRDDADNRGASYAFVTNGKLAAGIYTNVMDENLRAIITTTGKDADRTFAAAPGKWTYREIATETIPPVARLVVATDLNADGKVTWQDAAIAYRAAVPQPYGGDKTKDYAIAHIAMNFGSQATNPFLRVLDNAKKIWLYTDGLGQRIQYKGFAGEGHDSSHPDYAGNVGKKAGGRDELNFAMRRGHDFNVQSGVHINAHEYHKEAKWFSPDIADLNAIGWSWLDESYLTDYRYDSAYGTLYKRLDAMREDLPYLDFAYLDVYYGRGWPGWRMHTKTNSLGILQFTEFPGVMERAVVWNHVANDWTQAIGGKGDRSEIARFIWFSQKDTFKHEPLLRGTNCDGFMGWHAERNMLQTIKSAFTVNLPTKYLQHAQLVRQEKDQAWFSNGSRVESDGTVSKLFGRDGQLINSCRYEKPNTRPVDNFSFIPWNPNTEEKIYIWSDKGGDLTGELPKSWTTVTTAQLYRLTDLGRVFERDIALQDGKAALSNIAENTPYVLYRSTPPALPDMKWGEGGLVKDPGFDSHTFTAWKLEGSATVENHPEYGQSELSMAGPKAAAVRQTLEQLTPGQTYAASVWANIEGNREASLGIVRWDSTGPAFIDNRAWRVIPSVKSLGSDKPQNILDNKPDTMWHSVEAKDEQTKQPHSVTIAFGTYLGLTGFTQTCRADKGNGAIKGYIAELSIDGKTWAEVAKGDFDYRDGATATVEFKQAFRASHFRLTATSTLNDRPFTSIAELDPIIQVPKPAEISKTGWSKSNTINQTRFINYTDQSSKYMRNWHRLKLVFTAPTNGRTDVVLHTGEGAGKVAFDDVRVVKTDVSEPPAGASSVVLYEDFENCDEGWGPFMYGWQGPMNTHLSEANPPYTNDTIGGKYSLKSRLEDSPNLLYRTVPATLKLKPNTTYKISFDYLCDKAGCFALFAGPDAATEFKPADAHILKDGSWKVTRFTGTFKTDANPDWFVAITKLKKETKGTVVIDNLLITE
ncbi:MAG: discoidin domain-containing protein [Verrucomicrobia bacterium]|nr:discoidin domain-containing protein [Verrucomicrobiota bacterium]